MSASTPTTRPVLLPHVNVWKEVQHKLVPGHSIGQLRAEHAPEGCVLRLLGRAHAIAVGAARCVRHR